MEELPQGWLEIPTSETASLLRGISYKKEQSSKSPKETFLPVLRANNLRNEIVLDDLVYVSRDLINEEQIIKKNDIIFAMSSGSKKHVGKCSIAKSNIEASFGAFCGLVRVHGNLNAKFLAYYFRSNIFRHHIEQICKGTNINNLKREHILDFKILFPPLNEQHRIVTKIEELFSELDKGIESLKTARQQLKVYRQAVLKHAFEGKLTEKWREENKDKLETADELLARIKQEREAHYQQQLKEWKSKKQSRKPIKLRDFDSSKTSKIQTNSIPSVWVLLPLEQLAAEAVLGKMLDKQKNTGVAKPYLGNINLRWGYFELNNLKTMKIEKEETARYSLKKGDLVICEGGEPGRCAIWNGEDNTMFIQKALHRVRFTQSYNPVFAYYFMVYAIKTGSLERSFTGTTIKHLTGKGLSQVCLPLCSKEEQYEIVHILEKKLSIVSECKKEIDLQLQKSEALRQSLLKQAFSGKLVAQDKNDEPASALLEQIKAEKIVALKTTKKKSKRNAV